MGTTLNSYMTLGRSGLHVSPYCLGAMTFGEDLGWGASVEVSEAIISEYLEQGGNFIDTANIYTWGHSEKIIGDYFAARPGLRDSVVLGTKFFCNLHPGDPNAGGANRKSIIRQCEESLRRLQTDYIDIYWLHNWDPTIPVEETLRGLDDLVRAGKIRYVGISDLPAWVVSQAQMVSMFKGFTPIAAMQIEYSLLQRTVEGELIPAAVHHGIAVTPWGPLKNGQLTGKYSRQDANPAGGRSAIVKGPTDAQWDIIDVLREVAHDAGVTMAEAALAWVRARPGVTSTLIGARTVEQLNTNLASLAVRLSDEQTAKLNDASEPQLNFPANIHTMGPVLAYGGSTVDGRTYPDSPLAPAPGVSY